MDEDKAKNLHFKRLLLLQGVVACDPEDLDVPLPSSATELRIGAWVLSGNSILKDGRSIQVN